MLARIMGHGTDPPSSLSDLNNPPDMVENPDLKGGERRRWGARHLTANQRELLTAQHTYAVVASSHSPAIGASDVVPVG